MIMNDTEEYDDVKEFGEECVKTFREREREIKGKGTVVSEEERKTLKSYCNRDMADTEDWIYMGKNFMILRLCGLSKLFTRIKHNEVLC